MRIGIVADTHCPEFMDRLPERLLEVFRGTDLILHAGDVGGQETLECLRQLAPVEAVKGDHDQALVGLPDIRRLELEGRRVAIVHGNRSRLIEEPVTFVGTVSLGRLWPLPGLDDWLVSRFPDAEVIVHGHTHLAQVRRREGKLLINPGAVYQVTEQAARHRLERGPGWFEWTWLQVARHRRQVPRPTAAILEIDRDREAVEIIPL